MSADNWTTCPQCEIDAIARRKAKRHAATEAYGKVPVEQFVRLETEADKVESLDESLREDFHIGIRDARFKVGYSARCVKCGFSFDFTSEDKLKSLRNARSSASPSSGETHSP